MEESYDAVVVGSGYGGAVAACRMSMAGINVCLLEKGRRWEAQDFPRGVFSLLSAVRMEWGKWGIAFGSDKALFQGRGLPVEKKKMLTAAGDIVAIRDADYCVRKM